MQIAVLRAQLGNIQLLVNDDQHLRQRERFEHIVAGSGFHGFHGGFNGPECGHHHDWQGRIVPLDGLQKFQAVHAGKLEIGNDEIDRIFAQQLESGFGVSGGERGETVLAEIQLQQTAHLGFVFDN